VSLLSGMICLSIAIGFEEDQQTSNIKRLRTAARSRPTTQIAMRGVPCLQQHPEGTA